MANESKVSSDEKLEIDKEAVNLSNILWGAGAVAIAGACALGLSNMENLLRSYLVAFMFSLSIGLGVLWFVTINHLTNAKWSIVVRRVAEIIAVQMPVLAVLSLGVVGPMALAGADGDAPIQHLYVWLDEAKVHADHLLHHKSAYLNKGFFLIRIVVYFVFWVVLSLFFYSRSVAQDSADEKGSAAIVAQLGKVSAPAMIGFVLTLTFCAFDLLMSLDATWFSTIFGVYYFAGCVISGYSVLALALMWLQKQGRLSNWVNANHYHDLGKMMFAFVIFWAYIGFSQFMLIWYGDVPEETHWYHWRFRGDWRTVSTLLLVCHFVVPFFGLLSRHVKRKKSLLAFWAVWLLAIHYVDLYWLVFPRDDAGIVPFGLVDVLMGLGVLAIFLGTAARAARGVNLVPTKDPRLPKSLAFDNY
jgi:hypothetical protein